MAAHLQLVKDAELLAQVDARVMRCEDCGGLALATRTDPGLAWRLRHDCAPQDDVSPRTLGASLLACAGVLVLAAAVVGWLR